MSRKLLIKLLLSAAMLALVLYSVDFNLLAQGLKSVPLTTVIVLVGGYLISQILSATRWWIVTRGAHIGARYRTALSASLVGVYLNCFGLGTLGGDFARAMLLTNDAKQRQTSLATVVADRVFGMAVLLLIGLIGSFFFFSAKLDLTITWVAAGIFVLATIGWFAGPRVIIRLFGESKWGSFIERFMKGFPTDPGILGLLLIVATVFHLLQIQLFQILAAGLGVHIPFSFLLVSIPFANIISTLPVSWMGLGVRENVYVFFFVPAFLTHEQAVLCGALWLFAITCSSAVGGIVAVVTGDLKLLKRRESVKLEAVS